MEITCTGEGDTKPQGIHKMRNPPKRGNWENATFLWSLIICIILHLYTLKNIIVHELNLRFLNQILRISYLLIIIHHLYNLN